MTGYRILRFAASWVALLLGLWFAGLGAASLIAIAISHRSPDSLLVGGLELACGATLALRARDVLGEPGRGTSMCGS